MKNFILKSAPMTIIAAAVCLASMPSIAEEKTRGISLKLFDKSQSTVAPKVAIPPKMSDQLPSQTNANRDLMGGFKLNAIKITGNKAVSDAELLSVVSEYLGSNVFSADLEDIRLKLSQHYALKGFINSGAVLPDQDVSNGEVTFNIIEGRITQLNVDGAGHLSDTYFVRHLETDKPLNKEALQTNFQLLLEDPLIDGMSANLKPGDKLGEATLDLTVQRAKTFGLEVSYDNYRPVATGAEQARVSTWVRNLTGFGDLLELSASTREGSDGYDVRYELPIGLGGTSVGFSASDGDADVIEASIQALDINSQYSTTSVFLNKEFAKSLSGRTVMGIELSSREVENTLLGLPWSFSPGENEGLAKVSALRLNMDRLSKSEHDVLSLRATLSYGLDAMDSTQNADGRPDSDFASALVQAQYARILSESGLQLQLRSSLQWSNEALLPVEQIAIGGVHSVRGYRENELVRDKAFTFSAQLSYPLSHSGSSLGAFNALLFTDFGTAENHNPTMQQGFDQMSSVGVGLQWRYKDRVSADIYIAHALEEAPEKSSDNLQDDGVHFRISLAAF